MLPARYDDDDDFIRGKVIFKQNSPGLDTDF